MKAPQKGDPASRFGAIHAVDIEYAFNTLDTKSGGWQQTDHSPGEAMAKTFANLVGSGDPRGQSGSAWREFDATDEVMYFEAGNRSGPEAARPRHEFLQSVTRARKMAILTKKRDKEKPWFRYP